MNGVHVNTSNFQRSDLVVSSSSQKERGQSHHHPGRYIKINLLILLPALFLPFLGLLPFPDWILRINSHPAPKLTRIIKLNSSNTVAVVVDGILPFALSHVSFSNVPPTLFAHPMLHNASLNDYSSGYPGLIAQIPEDLVSELLHLAGPYLAASLPSNLVRMLTVDQVRVNC